MKKLFLFSLLAAAFMFAACGGKQQAATTPAEDVKVEAAVSEEAVDAIDATDAVVVEEVAGEANDEIVEENDEY